MGQIAYPKRLIEVDLPIKRVSAHARREKSIRHGHISTLHIWWARRPLAACRAVLCASLWPDPGSEGCPAAFTVEARRLMLVWAKDYKKLASPESYTHFDAIEKTPELLDDGVELRKALLDFIADFANWDNSTSKPYLETARALTQAAHVALGGEKGSRPLVVDPFAGGGAIPLEALRMGADAFASDLNPVAVLLNKVVLDYIPKHGQRLADEVRKWGEWVKERAEKELVEFYPKDPDGGTPIAYLWARTIRCEGPGCGAEVPLIRSLWLAKKAHNSVALQLVPRPRAKRVDFKIIFKQPGGWLDQDDPKTKIEAPNFDGTTKGATATCPCCGFTTAKARIREQLVKRRGGANDARLLAIVTVRTDEQGRAYRLAKDSDVSAVHAAARRLTELESLSRGTSPIPDEEIPQERVWKNNPVRVHLYGMTRWRDIFTDRQTFALATYARLVRECGAEMAKTVDTSFREAVQTCLALIVDRCADKCASVVVWHLTGEKVEHVFGRQALPMVWDFADGNPLSEIGWSGACNWVVKVLETNASVDLHQGLVQQATATAHPLPNDSAQAFVTDPPYYDAVPYSTLSNFFYVWLKRTAPPSLSHLFAELLTPNAEECVLDEARGKTHLFYEAKMTSAMAEGRRVLNPDGVGVVVFAHKSTSGWEAMLQAIIEAGWTVTGSWPIDTEMGARLRARDSAVLASSVHLVCRPRENPDGSIRMHDVGDWRDVLAELPKRIHVWMPRLQEEGVVGADAIFACLGPALEVFSRYSRVEKASGEVVTLKEYLEQVWAAISKEALTMIFEGAQTTGFEEDARLTAMWLWTLSTGSNGEGTEDGEEAEDANDEESPKGAKKMVGGFNLEYDAARKIAQGLGAHLEQLQHLVQVKGDTARLLPVAERTRFLFGKDDAQAAAPRRKKKDVQQVLGFADELEAAEEAGGWGDKNAPKAGETVLDRVHQAMILFAAGRSDALKRFLVEDGIGHDNRFWVLAQALSALYPKQIDEKRWVDGVLARKKGLGF